MKIERRIKLPLHYFLQERKHRIQNRMKPETHIIDLAAANAELEDMDSGERILWARKVFGEGLIMSSSFGLQSAVLLHLVNQVVPGIPVVFVDTGYLFKETYQYAEQLEKQLDLNVKVYTSTLTPERQEALHGKLWEKGEEGLKEYGLVRKVEPMSRAVRELGATAWLTGVRREQARSRRDRTFIQLQNKTYKIYPILNWDQTEILTHMLKNDLPAHPLSREGYIVLGDCHSTRKFEKGMDAGDVRFDGLKWECGLHEDGHGGDYSI